ncbi:MAG: hypothetical protein QOH05_4784 [Acetobacteraceae bacterium]|nr:hypothetical protein [Acetobacteraceae bacterium]
MIVSVMYRLAPGQKFDLDYYMKTHMPMVGSLWAQAGLKGAQVLHGVGSPQGDHVGYQVLALLDFESLEAFKAAADRDGAQIFGDIPNFTEAQPEIQFNERLG